MMRLAVGDVVRFRGEKLRVTNICHGECSHRAERGIFLQLGTMADEKDRWNHVAPANVKIIESGPKVRKAFAKKLKQRHRDEAARIQIEIDKLGIEFPKNGMVLTLLRRRLMDEQIAGR